MNKVFEIQLCELTATLTTRLNKPLKLFLSEIRSKMLTHCSVMYLLTFASIRKS